MGSEKKDDSAPLGVCTDRVATARGVGALAGSSVVVVEGFQSAAHTRRMRANAITRSCSRLVPEGRPGKLYSLKRGSRARRN
eukprot:scaffold188154_cov34-Tisochrysis_lutea.AAC.1